MFVSRGSEGRSLREKLCTPTVEPLTCTLKMCSVGQDSIRLTCSYSPLDLYALHAQGQQARLARINLRKARFFRRPVVEETPKAIEVNVPGQEKV